MLLIAQAIPDRLIGSTHSMKASVSSGRVPNCARCSFG
jgi:hypothetical protein